MMVDTLMALWNRSKDGVKILFTFLLICISTSLLLAAVGLTVRPAIPKDETKTKMPVNGKGLTATTQVNKSVAAISSASERNATPTSTPRKISSPASTTQSCTALPAATNERKASTQQTDIANKRKQNVPTKGEATASPPPKKSSIAKASPTATVIVKKTPTGTPSSDETETDETRSPPSDITEEEMLPPFLPLIPPILGPFTEEEELETPTVPDEPTATETARGTRVTNRAAFKQGSSNVPPTSVEKSDSEQAIDGRVAKCLQNSVGMAMNANIIALLGLNIGLILGGGLLGTVVFYGVVYLPSRKILRNVR